MYLLREFPDEIDTRVPRFVHLPRYVAREHRRVPDPPAFLFYEHIEIETRAQVECLIQYLYTCITLATQTAFDGVPVLTENGTYMTCQDIIDTLIYWTTVSIGFFYDNFTQVNDELFLVLQLLKRARDDERFDHGGASLRFSILNQLRESLQSAM